MSPDGSGHQPTDRQPTDDPDRIHARLVTEPLPDGVGWRVAAVAWRDEVTVWAGGGVVVVKRDIAATLRNP